MRKIMLAAVLAISPNHPAQAEDIGKLAATVNDLNLIVERLSRRAEKSFTAAGRLSAAEIGMALVCTKQGINEDALVASAISVVIDGATSHPFAASIREGASYKPFRFRRTGCEQLQNETTVGSYLTEKNKGLSDMNRIAAILALQVRLTEKIGDLAIADQN